MDAVLVSIFDGGQEIHQNTSYYRIELTMPLFYGFKQNPA
jgi:hypothetical protein